MTRFRNMALVLTLGGLMAGCYPVELSVTRGGEIVVPRAEGVVMYNPATGAGRLVAAGDASEATAFAVASPDGSRLARAVTVRNASGDPGSEFVILITDLRTLTSETVATCSNGTFIQWDPQGRFLSYSFVSGEQFDDVTENMPELHLYDLEAHSEKQIATNVAVAHYWLPDGSGIVLLRTEGKDTDGRIGALGVYDLKSGKIRRVTRLMGAEWFALSPDGAEVITVAQGAQAATGGRRSRGDQKALYAITLERGSFRRLEFVADHARYSPDGQRVAYMKDKQVWVTNRELDQAEAALSPAAIELGQSTKVHLTWYDATQLLVIRNHAVFGVAGLAPELILVNTVTGEARNLQPEIDRLARRTPNSSTR